MAAITEQMWSDYRCDGFMRLGTVLDSVEAAQLAERADDHALGRVQIPGVQMQHDPGDTTAAIAPASDVPLGTVRYRRIHGLEADEPFRQLVRRPLFLEIAAQHYGAHAPVSLFRAMVFNKPAACGSTLPWHQDGGAVWALDRDPLVTIWIALDDATVENGCVEVVRGSHRLGVLGTIGGNVSDEDAARHCTPDRVVPLELQSGHAVLMHNWLIHRSGSNPSSKRRRAFSACYMDGRTMSTLTGDRFPIVAGTPPEVLPFVRQQREHVKALEERVTAAEVYAASLAEHQEVLRASHADAEAQALSLQRELERVQSLRTLAEEYAASLEAERATAIERISATARFGD